MEGGQEGRINMYIRMLRSKKKRNVSKEIKKEE